MKLAKLPGQVPELSTDLVVFAERPWTPDSEMILRELEPDGAIPSELKDSRFRYCLELSVIDEFTDSLKARGLTAPEQLDAILYYAEYDAFPAWLNRRLRTAR
jgi:hypothetical protein